MTVSNPSHRGRRVRHAKSLAEEWPDLRKVVSCAIGGQVLSLHDGVVGLGLGVTHYAAKLLNNFVELLELAAKRVALFENRALEHVE